MTLPADTVSPPPRHTPLHALHEAAGARMVPFAGYAMPVQYPAGIIAEHLHTRAQAGLFDVSHMGQAILRTDGGDPGLVLEALVPGDIAGLPEGRQRYTLLTDEGGGIRDDLMVSRLPGREGLFLVVNAACKEADFAHIAAATAGRATLTVLTERVLLALQGPAAVAVLARLAPMVAAMPFMSVLRLELAGIKAIVTRSGYTGEDGFEISVSAADGEAIARRLLAEPEVRWIGLGARDSLRLEAGLCLYGHDIDIGTTPVTAQLAWTIGKARRPGGDRAGGFPGAARILAELGTPPALTRVGLAIEGRQPVREGAVLLEESGAAIGRVTSGGFGPSLGAPIAMGYVSRHLSTTGTPLVAEVRGKPVAVKVASLPFTPHRYKR